MRKIITNMLFAIATGSPMLAGTITLRFEVNVWAQFNYATQTYAPDFQPFAATAVVVFDDAVTGIEQDPNDVLVSFGLPLISSTLTQYLPYGPTVPPSAREVALANRDYGPSQQWSELSIVQSQETVSGATTWAYDFDIDSSSYSLYPLIPNLLQDSSAALYQQLLTYQQNDAAFSFGEYGQQFDSQTGQPLAGIGFTGTAYLVGVSETPEPSTAFLMATGILVLRLLRNNVWLTSTKI
jgi:hypothetical protein